MFDFQVDANVGLVKKLLAETQNRDRGWMG
jgi:hypothetical protein